MENKTLDIKDYLHLYLGCSVSVEHDAIMNGEPHVMAINAGNLFAISYKYKNTKLILRKLSSMTEEEFKEAQRCHPKTERWVIMGDIDKGGAVDFDSWSPYSTRYLLSKGFDLFGLIDSGLAIEKTS